MRVSILPRPSMAYGRPPDFIGLGGGRSGTNWLAACLDEHPRASVPVGEIHFFSRERAWRKGRQWYESMFASCPSHELAGECSSSYWASEEAPARIASLYPHAKLIVSLRDPVNRAFSQYRNELGSGRVRPGTPFLAAYAMTGEYAAGSRHATNLERYLSHIPRERIHIMVFEETFVHPERALAGVFGFLGIDSHACPRSAHVRINQSSSPRSRAVNALFARGSGLLKRPGLVGIWRFMQETGIASSLKRLNARHEPDHARMPAESERRALRSSFVSEIARIEGFLGRHIPSWRA